MTGRKRRALPAVLLVVALATVGCSPDEYVAPPPAQGSEVADPATAANTLASLQDAVVAGDAAAAGDLATDDARPLLESLAANAQAIDLTDVTFRYVTETGRTSGTDGWDGLVAVTWRIEGFDEASARAEIPLSFADGGRQIAAIGDQSGRLPVWLTGPVTVERVPGGLVLVSDSTSGAPADRTSYARWVRKAVAEARAVVGGRTGLVVEVPRDAAALHRALGADPGSYGSIAAVTAPVDGSRVTGSPIHVFVNPAVYDDLDPVAAQVVMTHEAVHALTGAVLARNVPLWLVEGFADYVALRDVGLPLSKTAGQIRAQVRKNGVPKALPEDAEFNPAGTHLGAVYEAAWQVTVTLAERRGERALVDFYRAMLAGKKIAPTLRAAFDWSVADLTTAWQAQLAALAGVPE
ncbi:hypothetical protein [Nocardioides sp. WS12]|uniref:hypothetical protein n=1 Tax=Nocardioides sp. WS12 TaxID=2486272 RepID=UPI0015FDD829|nr:hypothetical protein [Nocardioides sp. WS12]